MLIAPVWRLWIALYCFIVSYFKDCWQCYYFMHSIPINIFKKSAVNDHRYFSKSKYETKLPFEHGWTFYFRNVAMSFVFTLTIIYLFPKVKQKNKTYRTLGSLWQLWLMYCVCYGVHVGICQSSVVNSLGSFFIIYIGYLTFDHKAAKIDDFLNPVDFGAIERPDIIWYQECFRSSRLR